MSRGPLTTHIPHFGNTVRMSFFTSLLLRIKIFFFILIPAQNLTSSFHPKHLENWANSFKAHGKFFFKKEPCLNFSLLNVTFWTCDVKKVKNPLRRSGV